MLTRASRKRQDQATLLPSSREKKVKYANKVKSSTRVECPAQSQDEDGPGANMNVKTMTVFELKAELRQCHIDFAPRAKKSKLQRLLTAHLSQVNQVAASKQTKKKRHKKNSVAHSDSKGLQTPVDREAYLGALHTTDACRTGSLLLEPLSDSTAAEVSLLEYEARSGQLVCQLDNVLSRHECEELCRYAHAEKANFQDLSTKYKQEQRRSSRLVVLDDSFAHLLFSRLQPVVDSISESHGMELRPLGFSTHGGTWKSDSINRAMRLSRYQPGGFFLAHKDAQYCPTADRRSLLSVIIYLNSAHTEEQQGSFVGGETGFYLPLENATACPTVPEDGWTIAAEIAANRGLNTGYRRLAVTPTAGRAVLFSHNVLHEATALTSLVARGGVGGGKLILKTDYVVSRMGRPQGFSLLSAERQAYLTCLTHFREAQRLELKGDLAALEASNALYERALSLRFAYPRALSWTQDPETARTVSSDHVEALLLSPLWVLVFDYLAAHGHVFYRLIFRY
jgi:hypothetical protein